MSPTDAYLDGGWPLVLIVLVTAVIVYLANEVRTLRRENKELTQASLDLLKRSQDRDAEELRAFREAAVRQREGRT